MSRNTIDAALLAKMFLAGAASLDANKEYINELNVFPVPDGDTGTNMSMTIMAAAGEVNALSKVDMTSLSKAISSGSLRGARGNSGVILSQLLRGFTKEVREYEEVDAVTLTAALHRAVKTAYKAVMKPKEGTILTVARMVAEAASELTMETQELDVLLPALIRAGEDALAQTPEMLPVLKEAGVVDSGGQGLLEILKGALDAYEGKEIDYTSIVSSGTSNVSALSGTLQPEADIRFGYCTEFIILLTERFTDEHESGLKEFLESIGDSIVCVADDDVVKVHVHTNDPGLALQKALSFGQLSRIKIDNMREEHTEKLIRDSLKLAAQQKEEDERKTKEPPKRYGVVAVSIGEGMNQLFRDIGADCIIEGGQTMNPSTDDVLKAIESVNAETVFVLPNNKNIILAANQASTLAADKTVIVIPTTTVPQGITALINLLPDEDEQVNTDVMTEAISKVKTGQVTYAVRDTTIDDKVIRKNDIMGIGDTGILAVGQTVPETVKELLAILVDDESELLSLYYGADTSEEDAHKLAEELEELYDHLDIDVHKGDQPVYYYVLSVE